MENQHDPKLVQGVTLENAMVVPGLSLKLRSLLNLDSADN